MVERQLKCFCYNYDEKYFLGHKCKEQNLFMAISENFSEDDVEDPLLVISPKPIDMTPPSNPPKEKSIISPNALTRFSTPQTLKLIGYIKHIRSSFLLIVEAPIILFIAALLKKLIVISVPSIIFKS
jgi:hypothetical protein